MLLNNFLKILGPRIYYFQMKFCQLPQLKTRRFFDLSKENLRNFRTFARFLVNKKICSQDLERSSCRNNPTANVKQIINHLQLSNVLVILCYSFSFVIHFMKIVLLTFLA